jgi:outer membrane protein assembly factor BamB
MKNKIVGIVICMLLISSTTTLALTPFRSDERLSTKSLVSNNFLEDRGTDWLMQQNNKEHTGYTSGTGSIIWPGLKWQFVADPSGFLFGTGPVIGNVYGGSTNEIVVACDSGLVYCLDGSGTSPTPVWTKQLTDEWVEATPAIGNVDGVSGNEVLVSGWEGHVYCLNGANGNIKWTSPWLNNCCDSAPVYGDVDNDGTVEVVVQSYSADGICVLNGVTGAVERTLATSDLDSYSPAIGNVDGGADIEIIGMTNYRVLCFNGATGALKWQSPMTDSFLDDQSDPTIADLDNDGVVEIVAVTTSGKVYCFNGNNGNIKWQCPTGYSIDSLSPAVGDVDADSIQEVIALNDHKLNCINGATGVIKWQTSNIGNFAFATPVICNIDGDTNKEIIICDFDSEIVECYSGTGTLEWQISTGGWAAQPPAVGDVDNDGLVEIITCDEDGKVFCIDQGVNHNPSLTNYDGWPDGVDPDIGLITTTFTFKVHYYDQDGQIPSIKNVVIDSTSHAMTGSGANADYSYQQSGFAVGTHNYYFYFEDGYGGTARLPTTGTWTFTVYINSAPNTPAAPQGQTTGFTNIYYSYTSLTTDPDGNNIYYKFDWGDGTYSGWLGPYGTGVPVTETNNWSTAGTYNVKVKAKDIWDFESSWSNALVVHIYNPTSRYAVVIGNENYLYANDLGLPIEDATDVKNTLINRGWNSANIHYVTDATASTIQTQLNWLRDQETESSISLFYYAGHGTQVTDTNGDESDGLDEALCGIDVNASGDGLVIDDWFKSKIDEFQGTVIIILDCCFSGGMNRTSTNILKSHENNLFVSYTSGFNGFGDELVGNNREILCAAQGDEVSSENDTLNNGLFTYYLVEGWGGGADSDNNHIITALESFNYADTHARDWQTNNWGIILQHPIMCDEYDGDIPAILIGAAPNYSPNIPDEPDPYDGQGNVPLNTELSVHVSDPDGNTMHVMFYWENHTQIGIDFEVENNSRASINVAGLQLNTLYSWYVIVSDGMSDTVSPTWEFTTSAFTNYPPNKPINPSPFDGETNVSTNPTLSVDVSDPDGNTMDVSFYNASDNSLIGIDHDIASGNKATYPWSSLNPLTTYMWYTIADDGEYTNQSDTWSFTTGSAGDNEPPNTPKIMGPANGNAGTAYPYSFNSTDPNGDDVSYYILWGDGDEVPWTVFWPSGSIYILSHSWAIKGSYTIQAKAKDIHGAESGWGTLSVTMPYSYNIPLMHFLERLLERFPHIFPILRHLMGY